MRRDIRVTPVGSDTLRVSFTYSDRIDAQKVAADLLGRIVAEHVRFRTIQSVMTVQFMKDSASAAAAEWESSLAKIAEAQTAGQRLERLKLDADIARKQYETLRAKVAEAEMIATLERRQQGSTLEVLEPAELPSDTQPLVPLWLLLGAVAGAAIGGIISIVPSPRRRLATA